MEAVPRNIRQQQLRRAQSPTKRKCAVKKMSTYHEERKAGSFNGLYEQ